MSDFESRLSSEIDLKGFDGVVSFDEPMSMHTTYRIGGPASCFARVDSMDALLEVKSACESLSAPFRLVGKGSNLLVSDDGVEGAVVVLGRDFGRLSVDAESADVACGAGVLLSAVVREALGCGLSGMEFATGTPGSVGGALRMNAGSATDWIGSRVKAVTSLGLDGKVVVREGSDVEWGYRQSSIPAGEVILECELGLEKGEGDAIRSKMDELSARRRSTQPLDLPSCGSVFRNPDGGSAAMMIDELGLKGTRVGGAEISRKHANFIVNIGGASAKDVIALVELARSRVMEAYGTELSTEVRFLGFDR